MTQAATYALELDWVGAPRRSCATAWRRGLAHHLRGDLELALAVYDVEPGPDDADADAARLLGWRSSARYLRNDVRGCRQDAERAFLHAQRTEDEGALAVAETALALLAALDGDRRANEVHHDRALRHAERSGEALLVLRVRCNRGSRLSEEGDFRGAVRELDAALEAAAEAEAPTLEALALANRGEAAFRLGRLEEALADLGAARARFQDAGSRMVAYASAFVADVHAERGESALARVEYEHALRIAEEAGDRQSTVPALAGLAVLLAEEDPEAAARLAARALALEPRMTQVRAHVAAGRVALARGDRPRAAREADAAAMAARQRRDLPGLAEALELQAAAEAPGEAGRERLEQAVALWRRMGDPIGVCRGELALAAVVGGEAGWELASAAAERLAGLGAHRHARRGRLLARRLAAAAPPPVRVECLGGFRVLRAGAPVPFGAWGSRKTRDLLKLLVVARGRPVRRDVLMEALWPEGDPAKCSARLSVALSKLRGVLDPGHRHPADAFASSDRHGVRLDLAAVAVDVEGFLLAAAAALAEPRERAPQALAAAEALYAGDAMPEDEYEDWSAPLRDEAREAYLAVVRRLAALDLEAGDHDAAARRFGRLLEHDPYDERAHRGLVGALVAAGRHGEARRRHARYASAMGELGLPAAPLGAGV